MGLKLANQNWVSDTITGLFNGAIVYIGNALKTGYNRLAGYTKFDYRPSGGGTNSYAVQIRHNVGNTSGQVISLDHEAHIVANGTASLRGVQGVAVVDAGKTVTGGTLIGTYGQARVDGAVAGNAFLAALYGLIEAGTAITAGHVTSLWLDSHQANAVTGEHDLLYMSNNGAASLDQFITATGQAETLLNINTAGGAALNFVSDGAAVGAVKKLKIKINGDTYYMNCNLIS